jgi:hypothetical protein
MGAGMEDVAERPPSPPDRPKPALHPHPENVRLATTASRLPSHAAPNGAFMARNTWQTT